MSITVKLFATLIKENFFYEKNFNCKMRLLLMRPYQISRSQKKEKDFFDNNETFFSLSLSIINLGRSV